MRNKIKSRQAMNGCIIMHTSTSFATSICMRECARFDENIYLRFCKPIEILCRFCTLKVLLCINGYFAKLSRMLCKSRQYFATRSVTLRDYCLFLEMSKNTNYTPF